MKKYDAISIVQVSLLIMTAIGLKNHVTVIPHLLAASKRDAWLTVIICISWLLYCGVSYWYTFTNQPNLITSLIGLKNNIGKKTKWILSVPTSLVFVLLATVSIKELVAWTKVTYLPFTPSFFTISLFVLLCLFLVSTSLQTMSIVNTFVLSIRYRFWFFCSLCQYPI